MNNVMNIRKFFFIVKHFYKSRKNVMRIISATMISVFLIMVTLLIIKTNESAILNELFDTYGKYTVSIDEEALPRFNEIQEDSKVKDFITFFQSEYKIDEFVYTNYYAKPEIIEFKNIKLVDGHLPKYDNEIAVERNYLFNLGLTEEEMIGSIISFPTSENGKEEQLLVTGIIMQNEAVQGGYEENSVTAIFSERDVQPNQLLIQVISINDYMEILDYITKKYNINEDTCYVNFDLFTALGITTGDNTFQINEQYYIFLFSMIVVCTIVIMYNFIKIMIYNFQPEIAIMNLLGISNKMLRRSLILFIFSLVFIGSCVGILFGILCSSFIVTKITKTANSIFLIFKNFPYKTMAVSMLVYFILIILMLVPIFIYMKKFTPNYIIQASNARMLNKGNKYKKHLFPYKTKGFIRKIAKDNIASNKISFVFTCIGIAFSIFILVIGFFFLKLNLQVFGHDTHMDYKVTFQSEEEMTDIMIEERNSIYSQLIKRADLCNIYPVYTRTNVVDLEKKNLNTQYIRYLEEKVTTNLTLEFGNQKNIPLLVAILGYNEQQLQELYSVNGLDENAILQDNEVIVLNKTIPYRGGQGFSLNFETNDLLDLHLQNYDGETIRSNFKIKSIVDKLNIYPNGIYNMVCLIINDNTYKDWCEINVPNEFYIKILTNKYKDIGKIKELLIGKKFLTLSIPKEEEMLIIESNRILKTVLILFFMCIIISSGVSLASTLYMRIYTRETEYAMLQIIGMTTKQLKCIVYYEIFQIYIVGVFLAGILSYIGTYYMQVTLGEEIGMYMYNFPYKVYILSNILALIVLCFLSKPIFKRINNMNIIKVIKSVE